MSNKRLRPDSAWLTDAFSSLRMPVEVTMSKEGCLTMRWHAAKHESEEERNP